MIFQPGRNTFFSTFVGFPEILSWFYLWSEYFKQKYPFWKRWKLHSNLRFQTSKSPLISQYNCMFLFVFMMFSFFRKVSFAIRCPLGTWFSQRFHEKMKKRTSECIFVKTEGTRSSRWKFRPLYARYAADCNGTLKILVTKDRVWGSYGDVYWKLFRSGRSKSVSISGEFSTLLRCAADQKVSSSDREQNLLTSPTFDYEKQWRFSKFRRRIWAGPKFPRRSWAETPFMNLSK